MVKKKKKENEEKKDIVRATVKEQKVRKSKRIMNKHTFKERKCTGKKWKYIDVETQLD